MATRIYGQPGRASAVSGIAGDISTIIDTRITANAPAVIEASGILDKNNIIPVVAVAPLSIAYGQVWTKGNICYYSIVLIVPAQIRIAASAPPYGVRVLTGMPLAPGSSSDEKSISGIGHMRFGRATFEGSQRSAPLTVHAGDVYLLTNNISPSGDLVGNAAAGYTDFLFLQGHYLLNLTDSNP